MIIYALNSFTSNYFKMPEIPCPAGNCEATFRDDLPEAVLLQLIALHKQAVHPTNNTTEQMTQSTRMEKVKRPTVPSGGNSEDWDYFLMRWTEYKLATRLTGQDILSQLTECTSDDFRRDLNRAYGTLLQNTEDEALAKIKSLAIKPENILVARVNLHNNFFQQEGEEIRTFAARIKGQAKTCQFSVTKKCQCGQDVTVDYTDQMIRDTMIIGLKDEDIQVDILGQAEQNLSLEDTIIRCETKAASIRSASLLANNTTVQATSSFKKQQKQRSKDKTEKPHTPQDHKVRKPCAYCGQSGHSSKRPDRKKNCPAYNTKCTRCGMFNHFGSVCFSRSQGNASLGGTGGAAAHDVTSHDYASHDYSQHNDKTENNTFNTTDHNYTDNSHFFCDNNELLNACDSLI